MLVASTIIVCILHALNLSCHIVKFVGTSVYRRLVMDRKLSETFVFIRYITN